MELIIICITPTCNPTRSTTIKHHCTDISIHVISHSCTHSLKSHTPLWCVCQPSTDTISNAPHADRHISCPPIKAWVSHVDVRRVRLDTRLFTSTKCIGTSQVIRVWWPSFPSKWKHPKLAFSGNSEHSKHFGVSPLFYCYFNLFWYATLWI